MTAMNLIVQKRAGAAYLMTDTGVYGPGGRVVQFRPKVITATIGGGRAYAALSASGGLEAPGLYDLVRRVRARDVKAFLDAIEHGFNDLDQQLRESGRYVACGEASIGLVVALFDRSEPAGLLDMHGGASGYRIGNDTAIFGEGYRPRRLEQVAVHLTRIAGAPYEFVKGEAFAIRGADLSDPDVWDPERGAARLVEAQRRDPFDSDAGPHYAVGGRAVLTRVSAEGFSHRVVRSWPDRVGRRVAPRDPREYGFADRVRCRVNELVPRLAFPTVRIPMGL